MVMSSYEIEKKIMKDMESYDEFGGFYSVFFCICTRKEHGMRRLNLASMRRCTIVSQSYFTNSLRRYHSPYLRCLELDNSMCLA